MLAQDILRNRAFECVVFSCHGATHKVYVKGPERGPPVLVMHELPGFAEPALEFSNRLVKAGFRVYLPHLFGAALSYAPIQNYVRLCLSREFGYLRAGKQAPITLWLRALADKIGTDNGDRAVGVIGMCLTGAFVIPLILRPGVKAAVAAQPAIPFSFPYLLTGRGSGEWMRELNVPAEQVREAAAHARNNSLPILALRFKEDRVCVSGKIERLAEEFGDQLEAHQLDTPPNRTKRSPPHAVLTEEYVEQADEEHPAKFAYRRVVEFLHEHLS